MNASKATKGAWFRPFFFSVAAIFSAVLALPASAQVGRAGSPGAPVIGTAIAGNGQISVAFTAPSSEGAAPIVEYRAFCIAPGVARTPSVPGTSPVIVKGLANGAAYTCQVSAFNAAGQGPPSAPSNAVTPTAGAAAPTAGASKPGAPVIGVATAGNGQISVAFTAGSDGGAPIVEYRAFCIAPGVARTPSVPGTSPVIVKGLANGTAYTCHVSAFNAAGQGPASAPSNAVTPTAGAAAPTAAASPPGAPTNVTVTAGNAQATVAFTAPSNDGGTPIRGYIATCNNTSTGATAGVARGPASPLIVKPLANGNAYTCRVAATNRVGVGAVSANSISVTLR